MNSAPQWAVWGSSGRNGKNPDSSPFGVSQSNVMRPWPLVSDRVDQTVLTISYS